MREEQRKKVLDLTQWLVREKDEHEGDVNDEFVVIGIDTFNATLTLLDSLLTSPPVDVSRKEIDLEKLAEAIRLSVCKSDDPDDYLGALQSVRVAEDVLDFIGHVAPVDVEVRVRVKVREKMNDTRWAGPLYRAFRDHNEEAVIELLTDFVRSVIEKEEKS